MGPGGVDMRSRAALPCRRMYTWAARALAFALLVLGVASASAQEPEPDRDRVARARFQTAAQLYEQRLFREAAAEFERAYELSGRPQFLWNIAMSYQRAGDCVRALDAFERFLRDAPADDPKRREAEEHRRGCNEVVAAARAGASVPVAPPLPGAPPVPPGALPGRARARISAPGAAHEPPAERGFFETVPLATWIAGGVAVAAAAGAATVWILNDARYADLEASCGVAPGCSGDDVDAVEFRDTLTLGLWIGAGAAAVAAIAMYFALGEEEEAGDTASVSILPAGVQVRF